MIGYPDDMPPRYNACAQPCDMLRGPCACGAWHEPQDFTEVPGCPEELRARVEQLLLDEREGKP